MNDLHENSGSSRKLSAKKRRGLGGSLWHFVVGALVSFFAAPALPHPSQSEGSEVATSEQVSEDDEQEAHLRRFLARRRLELR